MKQKTIAQILGHDFKKNAYLRLYDSNGNWIYFEDSDGSWAKYGYDSNGNEIYFETSDGFCHKYEYDSNGNETYFEDSDGMKRGVSKNIKN